MYTERTPSFTRTEKTLPLGTAKALEDGRRAREEAALPEAEIVEEQELLIQTDAEALRDYQMRAQQESQSRAQRDQSPFEKLAAADFTKPGAPERVARGFVDGYIGSDEESLAQNLGLHLHAFNDVARGSVARFIAREHAVLLREASALAKRGISPRGQVEKLNAAIEKYLRTMLR